MCHLDGPKTAVPLSGPILIRLTILVNAYFHSNERGAACFRQVLPYRPRPCTCWSAGSRILAEGLDCWKVTGTKCAQGKLVKATAMEKIEHCRTCKFYIAYAHKF